MAAVAPMGIAAGTLTDVSQIPDGHASIAAFASARQHITPTPPVVIAHRGASGYRPENTLASFELAARMGADLIELDLVVTKDHVLIARHENEIGRTTDVASHPEYADRRTTKVVEEKSVTGWFTEDFTLAELKSLRATERLPGLRQENTMYDGRFEIPTFAEVLAMRARISAELRREVGLYVEPKNPTYFRSLDLDLETPLVRQVQDCGLNHADAPIFIQSFELTILANLRSQSGLEAPLVFLTSANGAPYDLASTGDPRTYADLTTAAGLRSMAAYVNGIGPEKTQVIARGFDGTLGRATTLVADAHAAGLSVHPYTFRAENTFLPRDFRVGAVDKAYGRAIDEQVQFLRTGIDGLFTDQPDIGVIARAEFVAATAAA